MQKEEIEKYKKAGQIAAEVRDNVKAMVKPGVKLIDVAEKSEELIRNAGAKIAFPINISVNEIAAHYTPSLNNPAVFRENDIVKLDVGVHIDGYIADTAATVSLDKSRQDMVAIVEKALENALKLIKPGINIGEIGETIENTIRDNGYKPVSNLTGHVLDRYELHAGFNIPNIKIKTDLILEEGIAVAIEPFLTDGGGAIKEGDKAYIYRYLQKRPVRSRYARQALIMAKNYGNLPFAARWLGSKIQGLLLEKSLEELSGLGALHRYAVLKEVNNGLVTQAEHTVLVLEKPIITTRI